ncbi:hypothetical protein [Longispora urticae]
MLSKLLYEPVPDHPSVKVVGRLRAFVAWLAAPRGDDFDGRMCRAAAQALVREAFRKTLAAQDDAHLRPDAFTRAWKDEVKQLLGQPAAEIDGWGEVDVSRLDIEFVWELFDAASSARHRTISQAKPGPSKPYKVDVEAETFHFIIDGDEERDLGEVKYGVCQLCGTGLLYKISFSPEWQYSGLGTLALDELQARHPHLTWYTTGQYAWSKGFYDRYRRRNSSPWVPGKVCPHFGK